MGLAALALTHPPYQGVHGGARRVVRDAMLTVARSRVCHCDADAPQVFLVYEHLVVVAQRPSGRWLYSVYRAGVGVVVGLSPPLSIDSPSVFSLGCRRNAIARFSAPLCNFYLSLEHSLFRILETPTAQNGDGMGHAELFERRNHAAAIRSSPQR